MIERGEMGRRQATHVNVIAEAGPIGRRIVIAEDLDRLPVAAARGRSGIK